jgi:hypothetical protein
LEHEDLFNEIFLDVIASGKNAQGLQSYHNTNHEEREAPEVAMDGDGDDNIDPVLLEDRSSIEPGTSQLSPVDGSTTPVLPEPTSTRRRRVTPDPPNQLRKKKKSGAELLAESLQHIAEAVAPRPPPLTWKERAIDLLWKDLGDSEDTDLQLEAVDALRDEASAISFCKMPPGARKRWIDRLRGV